MTSQAGSTNPKCWLHQQSRDFHQSWPDFISKDWDFNGFQELKIVFSPVNNRICPIFWHRWQLHQRVKTFLEFCCMLQIGRAKDFWLFMRSTVNIINVNKSSPVLEFIRWNHITITITWGFYSFRFPLFCPMGISMGYPNSWMVDFMESMEATIKMALQWTEMENVMTNGWFETLRVPEVQESSISHNPRWCARAASAKPSVRWWSGGRRRSASHAEFPGES